LLGLLLYKGREMNMRFCQVKRASEINADEVARTICLRNGQIEFGSEGHSGTPIDIWINPSCPGGKVVGIYHTHPRGLSEPSEQDILAIRQVGLSILCVHGEDALSCYKVR